MLDLRSITGNDASLAHSATGEQGPRAGRAMPLSGIFWGQMEAFRCRVRELNPRPRSLAEKERTAENELSWALYRLDAAVKSAVKADPVMQRLIADYENGARHLHRPQAHAGPHRHLPTPGAMGRRGQVASLIRPPRSPGLAAGETGSPRGGLECFPPRGARHGYRANLLACGSQCPLLSQSGHRKRAARSAIGVTADITSI
jgi:hypothetical protein